MKKIWIWVGGLIIVIFACLLLVAATASTTTVAVGTATAEPRNQAKIVATTIAVFPTPQVGGGTMFPLSIQNGTTVSYIFNMPDSRALSGGTYYHMVTSRGEKSFCNDGLIIERNLPKAAVWKGWACLILPKASGGKGMFDGEDIQVMEKIVNNNGTTVRFVFHVQGGMAYATITIK